MLWGFTEKSDFQWSSQKNIATGKEGLPKKGELGEFADLKGELAKKRQCGVFQGSVDTQCTIC